MKSAASTPQAPRLAPWVAWAAAVLLAGTIGVYFRLYPLTVFPHDLSRNTAQILVMNRLRQGVAVQLKKTTEEEVQQYREAIVGLSQVDGERERLDSMRGIIERWRESRARWLVFNIPNTNRRGALKLTLEAGYAVSSTLFDKHGLKPMQIREAYEAVRQASQERYQQRIAASQPQTDGEEEDS